MATSFSHTLSHNNTSVEWHKAGGPFATVPLPGLKSSLVWMDRPQRHQLGNALRPIHPDEA